MDQVLLTTDRDGVRTLTLNRPHRRNAVDSTLATALAGALAEADRDGTVAVIVLTGTDPAFCAGADMTAIAEGDHDAGRLLQPAHSPWLVLGRIDTPTIAAVNGPAVTGGLELALGCDLIVASDRATFADTHTRIGVHPGGGLTVLLPRAVGLRRARELSFTGNMIDAPTAERWGLVNRVVAHERLHDEAAALAADIVSNDRELVRQLNATYRQVSELPAAEGFELERRRMLELGIDHDEVAARRSGLVERGRRQHGRS